MTPYTGWVQAIVNGHVLGCCWDPAKPQRRVQVAIEVDGEIVAEGVSDLQRSDLAEHGEGARGFLIALPEPLRAPGRHRVMALAGPQRIPLAAAGSFWQEASSDSGWSDVVFELGVALPGQRPATSASAPPPPPPPSRHALIQAGWLLDAAESTPPPSVDELDLDKLVANLVQTARACAALGFVYIPALIPAKRYAVDLASATEREGVAAFNRRLRDVHEVELLDLLPVLRDAARHGSAYHRTDADWNDHGAFWVARALLKEAHKRDPALRPPTLADLHLRPVTDYCGTLADAPKLELVEGEPVPCEWEVEPEQGVAIEAHALHALRMPVDAHLAQTSRVHVRVHANSESEEPARVAIVGDAAALSLVPWVAERARRTTFFWTPQPPLTELELELPQVVFHLIREADLLGGAVDLHATTSDVAPAGASVSAPAQLGVGEHQAPLRASAAEDPPAAAPQRLLAQAPAVLMGVLRHAQTSTLQARTMLRANLGTIALVLGLTILSWPISFVTAGGGLDDSWAVGLSLAIAHGLVFGRQVIFTYGPLGFAAVPTAVTPGTLLAGEVLGGLIQLALVAVLLASLRRRMNLLSASVLALLAASLVGWRANGDPLDGIAFGLVALTLSTPSVRREQAFRRLAIGGGAFAALALLVKLNDGIAAGAVIAVGLLGGEHRRRDLSRGAASLLGTLVMLWLLLGQPLGALPDYLRNSYDVIDGYVEAMGIAPEAAEEWQLLLVLGSALALAIAAWRALTTERPRRGAALAAAVLAVHYFIYREAFVRYGPGHFAVIALLSAVALMIPWPRAQRVTGIAIAAMIAVAVFAVLARPVDEIIAPAGDARRFVSQVGDVLHPSATIAAGRRVIREEDVLSPWMVKALRGHCVNSEPAEIAVVWAHPDWRWCPLPVFQSYSAYTPRLDRLNAAAYADANHGPDRVLRQVDQAIDERNPVWESPLAMLSLFCHFTELEHSSHWQTLARVPNRCGTPHPLAVIHGSLGHTMTLPSLPADEIVVAAIDGIQVAGWERLATLLTRAEPRYVTVNGDSHLTFRVPPGTAGDGGLMLWVPPGVDYPPPFNLNMDAHTLNVTVAGHRSGSITVRLSSIPIESTGQLGAIAAG